MKLKRFESKFKIDVSNKKVNVITSVICLSLALIVAIVSGVQFTEFRYYQTEFILREDVVDEVIKFSEYSKHLKGTTADSDFYVINGTENTVAVVKKENAERYREEIPASATICGVEGNAAQISAAEATLGRKIELSSSPAEAAKEVASGSYSVAVMRHADAKKAVKEDESLAIAGATLERVPSLLLLGGTHPNEPAGQLGAVVFLENATVQRGILYIVTELNRSAFSHSYPQDASPLYYSFKVGGTTRTFKYGARNSNTVDQWPTPDIYTHSSGSKLSASEVRNMNRAYPGSENGTFTEQIAWAITNFVLTNNVTMVIDLHEASPEYDVVNAVVYHQDSSEIASNARTFFLEEDGISIQPEESAVNFHGLTHRELGDFTGAFVFLFETSNAAQGKIHGEFTEELITYENGYKDFYYEYADAHGKLKASAAPIRERVGRHVASVSAIISSFNLTDRYSRSSFEYTFMDKTPEPVYLGEFAVSGVPAYRDLLENGVQSYLLPSRR